MYLYTPIPCFVGLTLLFLLSVIIRLSPSFRALCCVCSLSLHSLVHGKIGATPLGLILSFLWGKGCEQAVQTRLQGAVVN